MKSIVTPRFRVCLASLPTAIRQRAKAAFRLWRQNHRHPSLHYKKIEGDEVLYSVRIGIGWRALGYVEDDCVVWFWIGSHADYDKIVAGR